MALSKIFSLERFRRNAVLVLACSVLNGCTGQSPTAAPSLGNRLTRNPASIGPTMSPMPSYSASTDPSAQPSTEPTTTTMPSGSPTISPVPTRSPAPTAQPSSFPTSEPTITAKPTTSYSPTQIPTTNPSSFPSQSPPTKEPTFMPTPSPTASPTVSPAPTNLPTAVPTIAPTISMMPSLAPTISPMPTNSVAPSAGPTEGPTFSEPPSDLPSQVPTEGPTTIPTRLPTDFPTLNPTITRKEPVTRFLRMVLFGVVNTTWSRAEEAQFEAVTSDHVRRTWNELSFSPVNLGRVVTRVLDELVLPVSDSSIVNATSPLQIRYEQTITYGDLNEEVFDPPGELSLEDSLFTAPFMFNQRPFIEDLIAVLENPGLIYLDSLSLIAEPQPPVDPDKVDRAIITIVVVFVSIVVIAAGGYIFYLMNRDQNNLLMDAPMASESYDDEAEDYFGDTVGGVRVPVATVPATAPETGESLEDEAISMTIFNASLEENDPWNDDDGGDPNNPSPAGTLDPTYMMDTSDPIYTQYHNQVADYDIAHTPDGGSEEDEPLEPSMDAFQMKIEDLDELENCFFDK